MANEYNCGGAWSVHWGSQEEYLFRSSTLPLALWKRRRRDQDGFRAWAVGTELLGPPPRAPGECWYPFTPLGGIYTPYVEVIAISDAVLPEAQRFACAVLTIAAQDLRTKSGHGQPFRPELLAAKLRTMLHMAIVNRCEVLVLGAIGCGAFLNPPREVAAVFRAVLTELAAAYPGTAWPFRQIDFAVIKSTENLAAFREAFS